MRTRLGTTIALALAALVALSGSAWAQAIPQPPSSPPSAADAATAKKNFESGLKLLSEGASAEALIAFESSYKLGGRPSALRNIAQCHRNLRHVVEAYEAYEQLLALHESQLSAADKAAIRQAMDELGLLTVTVSIAVNQPGAQIEIDGKTIGTSPLAKPKRVMVGEHVVRVTKAGFEPFEKPLQTRTGTDEKVDVALEPEKTSGRLVVREDRGRDVHVFVDDQDRGPAPWEGDVAAGEHTVELKGPRFASDKRAVRVARKERMDVALDAAPVSARLRVTTIPASATIELDGKSVGTGAWDGDVAPGAHVITVTLAGQPPVTRAITVERGETIAQEIPVVAAMGTVAPDYKGMFVKVTLFPGFPLHPRPDNTNGGSSSDGGLHLGLGGALRVGYSLDPIAFELVGAFMFEHRDETIHWGGLNQGGSSTSLSGSTDYQSNGPNAFIGPGVRVTSRDPTVRFTFGVAPGVSFRNFPTDAQANYSNTPCNASPGNPGNTPCPPTNNGSNKNHIGNPGYTTFGVLADGGMLVGSTPGAKFYLGVHAWIDVAPNDVIAGPDTNTPAQYLKSPGAGYIVATSGLQFYFGPVLGLQFGH